ncbi:hypothetical protein HYH03_017240 [Edaphochlamys debaryana]|uniref:Pentacotripeptide-repeat region of PRORP domain-containing protein n=1 Tax=Edaphochlamys debaryana TaxID=47281 RepID=A0A835XPQ5_9CHLO|nr:hypothetical protein HYH03_017240 [Edaphochlamys debaryana]|eukprot:KAG2483919.1 hypothetical protein HYH03_017240 [Edaphochlamys debaryana]
MQVYAELRAASIQIDAASYRVLMSTAIEVQQGMDVVDLLRACEEAHGPPPMQLYCSLISRLLKNQGRGTPALQAAYGVWRQLRATKYTLDAPAFRTGMNLCVELGRIGEARRLMDAMRTLGLRPGWGAYHILIKYHAARGDMDAARRVFAQLRAYRGSKALEISAYNTLLAGFVRLGDLTMARAVVDKARREGAAPDAYTFSCFASGLANSGRLDEAEAVLEEAAAAGVPPSPVVFGALLDGCARFNDWERVERLVDRMRSEGLRLTREHYNILIRGRSYGISYGAYSGMSSPASSISGPSMDAYEDEADDADALSSRLGAGAGAGLGPQSNGAGGLNGAGLNGAGYNGAGAVVGGVGGAAMLGGGLAAGLGNEQVEALLAEMRTAGIRPDAVTYSTLVDAAVRAGSIDAALRVLSAMRVEGVAPDGAVYTSLMKLFREQGCQQQALEFFNQLSASRSSAVDGWALSCLAAVHASGGEMEEAEGALRQANELAAERGMPPPPEPTYAVMQGYGQQRKLRPLLLVFRRFLSSGGRPHRKMCEFAYRQCLAAFDFEAAGQVLRAMRLMRGLVLREDLYRQQWQEAHRRLQSRRGAAASGSGSDLDSSNPAAEKWKWWFGLPNRYYESDWKN